jgi:hypothetical protein
MAIPYLYGTSFDTARCRQCWKEFPFAKFGDSSTTVYHHIMVMNGNEYAPPALNTTLTASSTKPLGSLFADDSTAYFVEDRGLSPLGDNLVAFDRVFAQVPNDHQEGGGLYSFQFPQSNASNYSTVAGNGGVVASGNTWNLSFSLTNSNANFFNVGDSVIFSNTAWTFVPFGGTAQNRTYSKWIISYKGAPNSGTSGGVGAGYTEFDALLENGESISSISFWNASSPRNIDKIRTLQRTSPITLNSESILTYRYVKTNDITTVKLADYFQTISYGTTNYTSDDTIGVTSFPDSAVYGGMALKGVYIQAEPETPIRWLGNIWQIVGRKVKVR